MVERYHNEFWEFDKVRRGFKSDETAQQLNDAFRLYHNFIKKHMALNGATPSQVAEIDIELSRNRWLSILKQSLSHPNTTKKEVILKWPFNTTESAIDNFKYQLITKVIRWKEKISKKV